MPASRRTLLRSALLVPVGVAAVSGTSVLHAPSAVAADSVLDGPITRSEVIARAQFWLDHQPGEYSQNGPHAPGPGDGHPYRRDCSGLVSMAWHTRVSHWTGSLPEVSTVIPPADLRAGDILNDVVNHVVLFDRWINDRGDFGYYSFGATPVKYRQANINGPIDGWPRGNYVARRYRNIREDGPVIPPRAPMPYESGRIVAGRSADGRLEAYAAGADGVWHAWQTHANGPWSPWQATGGPGGAELAIVPNQDGRMEVFALNGDVLQHRWQTAVSGGWSGWSTFGTGGHDLAVGANADGRVEVAASNANGVFHRWQTTPGVWSEWEGTAPGDNGPADARLEMAMSADGRLEIFALSASTFGHLFQLAPSGRWGAWESFGTGGHDLSVEHNVDGRLEVFASNPDGVFRRWQTGRDTWSEWRGSGGLPNARLATERTPDGRIEAFAINGSAAQHCWQQQVNGEFSGWEGFGTGGTEIGASKNADGRIDVFASSHAGIYHKWQTGPATWSGWEWLATNAGPAQA